MSKKIIIIGAGPVGCYTAQLLKADGFQPLLIEEHTEVGRPVHCTGLVGSKVFSDKRPYALSESSIMNVINGAVIHYDNQQFTIEKKKVAYVIDRERFDKDLSKGLSILFQNRFLGVEHSRGGYIIETDKDEFPADVVIGADGANSMMRDILNGKGCVRQYKGVQFRMKTKVRHKDLVEVFVRKHFFFWIVPERDDVVRIGTISENPYADLKNFFKEEKIKGEILERFGGLTSFGICETTVQDGIALVGDAAGQVKPLTYGGIYFGLKGAAILAHCIKENRLQSYDALWKKELAFEIKIGVKMKDLFARLDDSDAKKVFMLLRKHKAIVEKVADFENHSQLILELIKRPGLYPHIGTLFQMLFKTIL